MPLDRVPTSQYWWLTGGESLVKCWDVWGSHRLGEAEHPAHWLFHRHLEDYLAADHSTPLLLLVPASLNKVGHIKIARVGH